jgi:CTP:molybdopterin cytidylyltransferase MocA
MLEHQICSLVEGGVDEVVVVLGHHADLIVPHVKGLGVHYVVNYDYRLGKTTSIRAGLRSISSSAESILLMAVDQPRTKEIVSAVIQSHIKFQSLITSPRFRGHGGHPLIFSASLKGDLECISEQEQGLRQVFQAHRDSVTEVEINDPLVSLDINTFEDYEIAKKNYRA